LKKDEFLIDGEKSAMMTRQPLADRSRFELWQPERHGCQQLMGGATRRLVLADRRACRPGRSAKATRVTETYDLTTNST